MVNKRNHPKIALLQEGVCLSRCQFVHVGVQVMDSKFALSLADMFELDNLSHEHHGHVLVDIVCCFRPRAEAVQFFFREIMSYFRLVNDFNLPVITVMDGLMEQ